jgi:hypothetical protein
MTHWKYKVVGVSWIGSDVDFREQMGLEEAGRNGWELVAVIPVPNGAKMYFKQVDIPEL